MKKCNKCSCGVKEDKKLKEKVLAELDVEDPKTIKAIAAIEKNVIEEKIDETNVSKSKRTNNKAV